MTMTFLDLKIIISHSLQNHLYENALFFAERLTYEFPKQEDALYQLALVYYEWHKPHIVCSILKNAQSYQCQLLCGKALMEVDRYQEAEKILSNLEKSYKPQNSENEVEYSLLLYYLGRVFRKMEMFQQAKSYFARCLKYNPYMWCATEELAELGFSDDFNEVYEETNEINNVLVGMITDISKQIRGRLLSNNEENLETGHKLLKLRSNFIESFSRESSVKDATSQQDESEVRLTTKPKLGPTISKGKPVQDPINQEKAQRDYTLNTPRRSARILMTAKSCSQNSFFSLGALESNQTNNTAEFEVEGTQILSILAKCSKAYTLLQQYDCEGAIDVFSLLPVAHRRSGWVQMQLGKANYELYSLEKAKDHFEIARELEPYNTRSIEYYSSILWQLKDEVKSSYLAHEILEFDRHCPEGWVSMGNCFSLLKEHDKAIKCFQRAIQLRAHFTYAYTLCGHEFVANEDQDKAQEYFRKALRLDKRHYNAWYGLAMIYYRQEKYDYAYYYLQKALEIHGRNSILLCNIGMVLQKLNKRVEAIHYFKEAESIDPANLLVRFKKASTLAMEGYYEEAVSCLVKLKEEAPTECNIYFLLGKLYQKLGKTSCAIQHLTWAMDLDPKLSNVIRDAIEKFLQHPEESLLDFDDGQR